MSSDISLLISEKITLAITAWIIFSIYISPDDGLEIFFTLILIGILVIKELTDIFTTRNFRKKINIFIFVFLWIYIVIITQKLINIYNI